MNDDITAPYPEMEFRDGLRIVPPHVRAILGTLPTYTMTYDEAISLANQKLTRDYLAKAQKTFIDNHFREHR